MWGASAWTEMDMIRLAITAEAFEAIAATLPSGSVAFGARAHRERQRVNLTPSAHGRHGRAAPGRGVSEIMWLAAVENETASG
jgi:hypothetical protein